MKWDTNAAATFMDVAMTSQRSCPFLSQRYRWRKWPNRLAQVQGVELAKILVPLHCCLSTSPRQRSQVDPSCVQMKQFGFLVGVQPPALAASPTKVQKLQLQLQLQLRLRPRPSQPQQPQVQPTPTGQAQPRPGPAADSASDRAADTMTDHPAHHNVPCGTADGAAAAKQDYIPPDLGADHAADDVTDRAGNLAGSHSNAQPSGDDGESTAQAGHAAIPTPAQLAGILTPPSVHPCPVEALDTPTAPLPVNTASTYPSSRNRKRYPNATTVQDGPRSGRFHKKARGTLKQSTPSRRVARSLRAPPDGVPPQRWPTSKGSHGGDTTGSPSPAHHVASSRGYGCARSMTTCPAHR